MRLRHLAACALLWVGCSFVRDTDRFSEGSGGLGTGGAGNCSQIGAPCTSVNDCCSRTCTGGVCACAPTGSDCTQSADCCTGLCGAGKCVTCTLEGQACLPLDPRCCPGRSCVPNSDPNNPGSTCQVTDACKGTGPLENPDVELMICDAKPWECAAKTGEAQRACYADCLSSTADGGPGITKDCASCYAFWWGFCVKGVCAAECATVSSPECADCCNGGDCGDYFTQCSGLEFCPS